MKIKKQETCGDYCVSYWTNSVGDVEVKFHHKQIQLEYYLFDHNKAYAKYDAEATYELICRTVKFMYNNFIAN